MATLSRIPKTTMNFVFTFFSFKNIPAIRKVKTTDVRRSAETIEIIAPSWLRAQKYAKSARTREIPINGMVQRHVNVLFLIDRYRFSAKRNGKRNKGM